MSIEDPDSEDEDDTGTLIVGLMQKPRFKPDLTKEDNLAIGYYIFEVSCWMSFWSELKSMEHPGVMLCKCNHVDVWVLLFTASSCAIVFWHLTFSYWSQLFRTSNCCTPISYRTVRRRHRPRIKSQWKLSFRAGVKPSTFETAAADVDEDKRFYPLSYRRLVLP